MAQIKIGKRVFRTKGEAKKAIQTILNKWPIGVPLSGDDLELIISGPVDMHPWAKEKIRCGIKHIEVRMNDGPHFSSQRGFWIVRADGSEIDFGAYVMFNPKEHWDKRDLYDACRLCVLPETKSHRQNYLDHSNKCELTGVTINEDTAHTHHAGEWPFKRIVEEWLKTLSGSPTLVDMELWKELPPDLATNFRNFHNARAKYLVIHQKENSRLGARGE